jgi:uncharacterized membrane protein
VKSLMLMRGVCLLLALSTSCAMITSELAAQESVVDFQRDIKPIFEANCLECHGPDLQEGDLDFSDAETLLDFHEPGDASSSDLYDVLVNEDRLMPPEDSGGPLKPAEIALIKLWIDEGAVWPEGVVVGSDEAEPAGTESVEAETPRIPPHERPLHEKIWAFHGFFHPAVVHFPIALLTVAALFIVLHWLFKGNFREFAFYLLLLGALSSIVACTKGWAFAPERSLGGGIFDVNHELFRHRWLGVGVAVFTCLLTLLAMRARKSNSKKAQFTWQAGVILAAGLVGIAGHQGGELVYGEGLYDRAYEKYFGEVAAVEESTDATDETTPSGEGQNDSEAETVTAEAPTEGDGEAASETEAGNSADDGESSSEGTDSTGPDSETAPPVTVGGDDGPTQEAGSGDGEGGGEAKEDDNDS